MAEDPKTYDGGGDLADGKAWFRVEVAETYHNSYLVRALDEEDAQSLVDGLINADALDPTADGDYSRSVDPCRLCREPRPGERYWGDED